MSFTDDHSNRHELPVYSNPAPHREPVKIILIDHSITSDRSLPPYTLIYNQVRYEDRP